MQNPSWRQVRGCPCLNVASWGKPRGGCGGVHVWRVVGNRVDLHLPHQGKDNLCPVSTRIYTELGILMYKHTLCCSEDIAQSSIPSWGLVWLTEKLKINNIQYKVAAQIFSTRFDGSEGSNLTSPQLLSTQVIPAPVYQTGVTSHLTQMLFNPF